MNEDLYGARLSREDLLARISMNEDLSGANLDGARINRVSLDGANLTQAHLDGVIGADTSDARNVPEKYLKR